MSVALIALLFFLISGFFLTTTLASIEGLPRPALPRPTNLSITPTLWRRILAGVLIAATLIMGVTGAIGAAQGNHHAFSLSETIGPLLWAIALSLLTIWQKPFAQIVRNTWIFPLLLAWIVLIIGGILTNASDYIVTGILLLAPLISVTLAQADV